MGEKNETKSEGEKKAVAEGGEKAAAADGVGKKDEGSITVVLKLDLHCEGCAKKVRRSISHLEGVEKVKADCDAKKLTVTGNVDPTWLRDRVESKTKKKVELISPQPKKDGGSGGAAAAGGGDKKAEEKPEKKTEENKADDNKKPKEAALSTVVMKTNLHCDGCAHKIKRMILKNFDGIESITTDLQKDLVTVSGTMDVKELITYMREKLKRGVEIVPPKKDDAGGEKKAKEGDAGDKKEKSSGSGGAGGGGGGAGGKEKKGKENDGNGGGGDKKEGGGDKKQVESKPEGSGGEGSKGGAGEETKVEMNKMEYHSYNPQTYYAMPMVATYNQSYGNQDYDVPMYHHHHQDYSNTGYVVQYRQEPPPPPPTYLNMNDQMFSDENPNGCFVM